MVNVPYTVFKAEHEEVVMVGDTVNFTVDQVNEDYGYKWNFGDENSSTLAEPNHVYQEPGTYFIALQLTDAFGCENTVNYNEPITVQALTSLDDLAKESFKIRANPNPFVDQLSLTLTSERRDRYEITMRDIRGRLIWSSKYQLSAGEYTLNISEELPYIANGVYLLEVKSRKQGARQLKVFKAKP